MATSRRSTKSLERTVADELRQPLRIVARSLAEGAVVGLHRSVTKGSGVEFAGHRAYSPGDDLRHLDRHARLRHNRLLVRQFHTDTERAVHVVVDTSQSMAYTGTPELGSGRSKLDVAVVLAAALAHLTAKSGDEMGLTLLGAGGVQTVRGHKAPSLERALTMLEDAQREQHVSSAGAATTVEPEAWRRVFEHLGSSTSRGAVIFVLSDFLDFTPALTKSLVQLATFGRTVRAAQILTPAEMTFPFDGAMLFRDPETGLSVQTDSHRARTPYLAALEALTSSLQTQLTHLGGFFLRVDTSSPLAEPLMSLARGVAA